MAKSKLKIPVKAQGEVLSQLLECSFRGISFPVESLEVEVSHDVIQHKRMDRDGAKLENTGLGAYSYRVKAPFCNTIARGPMETWNNLYPDQKNKMLEALADRSTGDFVHPEFGIRRCKSVSFSSALDPKYRSGVVLSFALVEDTEDDDAISITQNSTLALALQAAINLDAKLGKLTPPPNTGLAQDGFKSFENFVRSIQAIVDQVGLLQKQIIGKIDRVIGSINRLSQSVSDTVQNLGNAPDQLIAALLKIKKNALAKDKELGYYRTQAPITVGQLGSMFGNTIQDLIELNPELAAAVVIAPFTIIRYYKL